MAFPKPLSTPVAVVFVFLVVACVLLGIVLPLFAMTDVSDDKSDQAISTNLIVFGVFAVFAVAALVWAIVMNSKVKTARQIAKQLGRQQSLNQMFQGASGMSKLFIGSAIVLLLYGIAGSAGSWSAAHKQITKAAGSTGDSGYDDASSLMLVGFIFQAVSVGLFFVMVLYLYGQIEATGWFASTAKFQRQQRQQAAWF